MESRVKTDSSRKIRLDPILNRLHALTKKGVSLETLRESNGFETWIYFIWTFKLQYTNSFDCINVMDYWDTIRDALFCEYGLL